MKTFCLFIALFAVIGLSSCRYSGSGELPETGVITPLAAYNAWYYDRTDFAKDGSSHLSTDSITIPNNLKVNYSTGITWYPYTDRSGMWRAANLNDANYPGLWRVGENLLYPQLWYKYPAKVGESFRWGPISASMTFPTPSKPDSVIQITANSADMLVDAKNMNISVPAGSFNCYKYIADYKFNGTIFKEVIEYVSPNEGKIMEEEYIRDYGSSTLRLSSSSKLRSKKISF